jgi:general secretion pathway protein J
MRGGRLEVVIGRNRQAGFTLLELLVALLVFSVLATMAYGGLSAVLRGREQIEQATAKLGGLQILFRVLERDLAQTLPRGYRDSLGSRQIAFAGGAGHDDLLEFTTGGNPDPLRPQAPDPVRIDYRLANGVLTRRIWPVLDRTQQTTAAAVPLLTGVAAVRVRFLDVAWRDTWPPPVPSGLRLPRAVEFILTLDDGKTFRRLMLTGGS